MSTRERHRITTLEVDFAKGRKFTLTLKRDGLHIRERFARTEKVHSPTTLVSFSEFKVNYAPGSPADIMDQAGEDLKCLALKVHNREQDHATLAEARRQVQKAIKFVRALELI